MGENLEGGSRGPIEVLFHRLPGGADENHEERQSVDIPAQIRTNHLQNTSQETCPCANLLGRYVSY
jgi:hypothetical protein